MRVNKVELRLIHRDLAACAEIARAKGHGIGFQLLSLSERLEAVIDGRRCQQITIEFRDSATTSDRVNA